MIGGPHGSPTKISHTSLPERLTVGRSPVTMRSGHSTRASLVSTSLKVTTRTSTLVIVHPGLGRTRRPTQCWAGLATMVEKSQPETYHSIDLGVKSNICYDRIGCHAADRSLPR